MLLTILRLNIAPRNSHVDPPLLEPFPSFSALLRPCPSLASALSFRTRGRCPPRAARGVLDLRALDCTSRRQKNAARESEAVVRGIRPMNRRAPRYTSRDSRERKAPSRNREPSRHLTCRVPAVPQENSFRRPSPNRNSRATL